MAESHGTREFKGGGELAPHPETAAQTHGRRNRLSTGNAGAVDKFFIREMVKIAIRALRPACDYLLGQPCNMCFVTSATERYLALSILATRGQSHGRRRNAHAAWRVRHKPTGGANRLKQAYECWRCADFAMAESHGTREFIGGGELVPRPETAAQTHGQIETELAPHPETAAQTHGRRQPFETSVFCHG